VAVVTLLTVRIAPVMHAKNLRLILPGNGWAYSIKGNQIYRLDVDAGPLWQHYVGILARSAEGRCGGTGAA